jgi:hypothetical protein
MSEAPELSAPSKLLSSATVAKLLGLKVQSMRVRRMRGLGPPFIRLGAGPTSRCAYRETDVAKWIASRPSFSGTCEEKAALGEKAKAGAA